MQYGATDYYDRGDEGCCLLCEDAEPGCLCYNCKCKKCFWYTFHPYEQGGSCDLADSFREDHAYTSEFVEVDYFSVIEKREKSSLLAFSNGKEYWIPNQFIEDKRIMRWILLQKDLGSVILPEEPIQDDQETISLSFSQSKFRVVRPYLGEKLSPKEIVIVNPKSGLLVVVR